MHIVQISLWIQDWNCTRLRFRATENSFMMSLDFAVSAHFNQTSSPGLSAFYIVFSFNKTNKSTELRARRCLLLKVGVHHRWLWTPTPNRWGQTGRVWVWDSSICSESFGTKKWFSVPWAPEEANTTHWTRLSWSTNFREKCVFNFTIFKFVQK